MLVAIPRNGRRARHQLRTHQNNDDYDHDRHEQFRESKGSTRTSRYCEINEFRAHRLTANNAVTDPAGTPLSGSTGAGQLTTTFATEVLPVGGTGLYVILTLKTASVGGEDAFTFPACLPAFVK